MTTTINATATATALPSEILVCADERWGDVMFAFRSWSDLRSAFRVMWTDMSEEELNGLEDMLPTESGIYPCQWVSENADGTVGRYADHFGHDLRVDAFEEGFDTADVSDWTEEDANA